MIRFEDIKGYALGQRAAFEALVCQLARREQQAAGATFRRVEGSGGDGGVEAYWMLPNGSEIGYQAKFFTRSRDVDWSQVDKSVTAVLSSHPKLTKYVVVIPCDFTDRSGTTGRGRTGWEHWEAHKRKWIKSARAKLKRKVEFVPWTADDIHDRLTHPEAVGLREYWFGAVELSTEWFRRHLESAVASLEDRYHPEDHVDVATQSLFDYITRHRRGRKELQGRFAEIQQSPWPASKDQNGISAPPSELVSKTREALEEILKHENAPVRPIWEPWDSETWNRLSDDAINKLRELRNWAWKAKEEKSKDDSVTKKSDASLDYVLSDLRRVNDALNKFHSLVASSYLAVERARVALLVGRAGSGKSHLLAHVAEHALSEGRPAVLILGQQLRDGALWSQILQRLNLQNVTVPAFLASLDAAAEAAGTRGLFLIDAINEGPGARLWKDEISPFITEVGRHPNLACVFSCRSEYVDYIVRVKSKLQRFEVRGFETSEEQENAARMYLDKRGISRPATPWLAPEFVNPLFLRSCCNALQQEGKNEFPRGLTGTKAILAFYIDSVARHLGAGRDGTNDLVGPTKGVLLDMAAAMAADKRDYISRAKAEQVTDHHFGSYTAPANMGWLDVLQKNGLVRLDPDPTAVPGDPLRPPKDVVRFSFQRFQDHLMADALLSSISDIKAALAKDGDLSFVLASDSVAWEWRGFLEALSTQIPERYTVELVDSLPGDPNAWWSQWPIPHAFEESVRWRDKAAFSDRTLELFNRLDSTANIDRLKLLLELSASVEHPWNARLIHRNLVKKAMPKRDAFWTVEINSATDDDTHPIWRLIDWSLQGQRASVTEETQRLCALILAWCFTSSSRQVRDHATKALTSLFLAKENLFRWVVAEFEGVDDLYVRERMLAAAYGACCLDRTPERLLAYAKVAMEVVFEAKPVPRHILLRDYARGIIELAAYNNALPKNLKISNTRSSYGSPKPKLTVTEAQLRKVAKKAGDETILNSCTGFIGDFGTYTITHAVSRFSAIPVSKPTPYSPHEIFERFNKEVVNIDLRRVNAWKQLRDALVPRIVVTVQGEKKSPPTKDDEARNKRKVAMIKKAGSSFLSMLSSEEQRRFWSDAAAYIGLEAKTRRIDQPSIDVAAARRWVAKRAYRLGWTKKRFPIETQSSYDYSRERPRYERIGKKYQWLALQDLMCQLADNYWLNDNWDGGTRRYETPLDIGFFRDIDPTVLVEPPETTESGGRTWMLGPAIKLPVIEEAKLAQWPFLADSATTLPQLVYRTDQDDRRWLTLYDHRSSTAYYDNKGRASHNLRYQEFRFVLSAVVAKEHVGHLIADISGSKTIDVLNWDPPEFTDEPYLYEASWRDTWRMEQWRDDGWSIRKGLPIAFPAYEYRWESHLDASLPNGVNCFLPATWLIKELGLVADRMNPENYADGAGMTCFRSSGIKGESAVALIDARVFQEYLDKKSLACVWLFVAERNAWPGGNNSRAAWRRSEGICRIVSGKPKITTWYRDHVNRPTGTATARRGKTK